MKAVKFPRPARSLIAAVLPPVFLAALPLASLATPGGHGEGGSGSYSSEGKTGPVIGGWLDGNYDGPFIGPATLPPYGHDHPGTISQWTPNFRDLVLGTLYTPGAFRDFLRNSIEYGFSWTPYGTALDVVNGALEIARACSDLNSGRIQEDEYNRRVANGLTQWFPGSSELDYFFGVGYGDLLEPIIESSAPPISEPQEIIGTEAWTNSHPHPEGPLYIGPVDGPVYDTPHEALDPGATQWYGW